MGLVIWRRCEAYLRLGTRARGPPRISRLCACLVAGLSAACAAAALEHDVAFHSEVFAF